MENERMQEQQRELEAYQEQERENYYLESYQDECSKKNSIMEECRALITEDIKAKVDDDNHELTELEYNRFRQAEQSIRTSIFHLQQCMRDKDKDNIMFCFCDWKIEELDEVLLSIKEISDAYEAEACSKVKRDAQQAASNLR